VRENNHPNSAYACCYEPEDGIGRERAKARPVLVLNPRPDGAFVDAAETLLDRDPPSPEDLQNSLRETYPNAVVRARELSGETIVTWYVFREGHWINGGNCKG
jgi:hypothetical protein